MISFLNAKLTPIETITYMYHWFQFVTQWEGHLETCNLHVYKKFALPLLYIIHVSLGVHALHKRYPHHVYNFFHPRSFHPRLWIVEMMALLLLKHMNSHDRVVYSMVTWVVALLSKSMTFFTLLLQEFIVKRQNNHAPMCDCCCNQSVL